MAYTDFVLVHNVWLVLGLWILVYTGDFLLTLLGATLYGRAAREYIVYEGS